MTDEELKIKRMQVEEAQALRTEIASWQQRVLSVDRKDLVVDVNRGSVRCDGRGMPPFGLPPEAQKEIRDIIHRYASTQLLAKESEYSQL